MSEKNFFSTYVRYETEQPFDLAKHSSIGVGGNAEIAFYPQTAEELITLLSRLEQDGVDWCALGNMTNVLPADSGTKKAIVSTKKLVGASVGKKTFAYAGETSGRFLRACRYAKKSGAEFLVGIPCTLGGALYMNAGVSGKYISEIVDSVLVVREGRLQTLTKSECDYAYKHSVFMQNRDVIVGATFCLTDDSQKNIEEKLNAYSARRKHLPKGKSMGCVFKNLDGISAGAYIEKAGLKGKRVGGAVVSQEHANFIINDQNATAQDVRSLILIIKDAVYKRFGVVLEEEIRYLE